MRCRLQTPDAVPPNTVLAVGATYAVRAGDTLAGLALLRAPRRHRRAQPGRGLGRRARRRAVGGGGAVRGARRVRRPVPLRHRLLHLLKPPRTCLSESPNIRVSCGWPAVSQTSCGRAAAGPP